MTGRWIQVLLKRMEGPDPSLPGGRLSGGQYEERKTERERQSEMTREEAYASCPPDSYVEFYGGRWLVVPFAPVRQPAFFVCLPGTVESRAIDI